MIIILFLYGPNKYIRNGKYSLGTIPVFSSFDTGFNVPFIFDINAYKEKLKTAKAEAVKEFAERLKEQADRSFWQTHSYVDVEDIDNLLKEMEQSVNYESTKLERK